MFDTNVVFYKREPYMQCSTCLMDTSDSAIYFNIDGQCGYCIETPKFINNSWFPNEMGSSLLQKLVDGIKKNNTKKTYNCIIGISGGIDSSYVALKAVEFGLRPLLFHVDAGWNSRLAVSNINKLCNFLNIDLKTKVINWKNLAKLQVSFLKSGILNQDIPQDHMFFSSLVRESKKNGNIPIINGLNFSSESVSPVSWGYTSRDGTFIRAIAIRFGEFYPRQLPITKIKKFLKSGQLTFSPLNLMTYNPIEAQNTLKNLFGWESYGQKHYESSFTKWFQGYYLPKRAGIDKRIAHFSSLIISGLISKETAFSILKNPPIPDSELHELKNLICDKLDVSTKDMENYINLPIRNSYSIKNDSHLAKFL
jgi:hypothetical protein